jgi:hypothetical protein
MNTEDAMRQAATAADFYMSRAVSGQGGSGVIPPCPRLVPAAGPGPADALRGQGHRRRHLPVVLAPNTMHSTKVYSVCS